MFHAGNVIEQIHDRVHCRGLGHRALTITDDSLKLPIHPPKQHLGGNIGGVAILQGGGERSPSHLKQPPDLTGSCYTLKLFQHLPNTSDPSLLISTAKPL